MSPEVSDTPVSINALVIADVHWSFLKAKTFPIPSKEGFKLSLPPLSLYPPRHRMQQCLCFQMPALLPFIETRRHHFTRHPHALAPSPLH